MEDSHRCKVCFRNFGNGRALGGHMRSHTINFSKQVKQIDHSCSSSQGEVVESREDAETASSETIIRSKILVRETTDEERSPASSVSDTTTEEDVAHCLMMLSRDRWERRNGKGDRLVKMKRTVRGKYTCVTCNKIFKSYQALGGHRASYKKIKADVAARCPGEGGDPVTLAEEKVRKCPFCDRVFASGQALGGHKRSHFMGASNVQLVSRNIGENLDIDLNLPAPVDDGDEINFAEQ